MNEGYLKYFGVLLCLFAVAAILPQASATNVNASLATVGEVYVRNGTYNAQGSWEICSAYGKTPVYDNTSAYTIHGIGYSLTGSPASAWNYDTPAAFMGDLTNPNNIPTTYVWTTNTGTSVYSFAWVGTCTGNLPYATTVHNVYNSSAYVPPPTANFTGAPLSGTVPLTVSFADTSTNLTGLETWNWSVSPAPGVSITTPAAQNTQMTFATTGNYTISHGVANSGGSDIETKIDYIYVYNSTAVTTLHVTAINALNAYPIHGAQVNLYDVENTSWSNTTTPDGTGAITALSTHTINAYANAAGFLDNDKLGIPVSNVYDSILLFPTNTTNVSAGNVTLFVSVFDNADHSKPIVGAGVTVITASSSQGQFTNSGGSAQFAVPNKTTVLIDVEAVGQGYNGATQSVYTGTGSGASASVTATVYLSKKSVTPTVSPTTLPGGGTPTPTITILPGCEDPMSAACQASQNDYSMGWLSQNGLMLIEFFVICFFVFMLKGMGR